MFEQLLLNRRSVRHFEKGFLEFEQIEKIIWAGIGNRGGNKRTAPSAGGCYPLSMYLVVGDVKDLSPCVFSCPSNPSPSLPLLGSPSISPMGRIKEGDFRQDLCNAALGQKAVVEAQIDLIIAADYGGVFQRYGRRGYRYAYIEAGHVGQNIALQAVELGLGTVMIGAFNDGAVKALLEIKEEPIYIIPVGLTRGGEK